MAGYYNLYFFCFEMHSLCQKLPQETWILKPFTPIWAGILEVFISWMILKNHWNVVPWIFFFLLQLTLIFYQYYNLYSCPVCCSASVSSSVRSAQLQTSFNNNSNVSSAPGTLNCNNRPTKAVLKTFYKTITIFPPSQI